MIKQYITPLIRTQRQKKWMKVILMMSLNQFIYINTKKNCWYQTKKSSGKGSGWIIDSIIDHNKDFSKCNLLAGSSYFKLPK